MSGFVAKSLHIFQCVAAGNWISKGPSCILERELELVSLGKNLHAVSLRSVISNRTNAFLSCNPGLIKSFLFLSTSSFLHTTVHRITQYPQLLISQTDSSSEFYCIAMTDTRTDSWVKTCCFLKKTERGWLTVNDFSMFQDMHFLFYQNTFQPTNGFKSQPLF